MATSKVDKPKIPKSRRKLYFFGGLALFVVFIIINGIVNPTPPETPAQAEAREKEFQRLMAWQKAQAARDIQVAAYRNELCHVKLVCRNYRSARQDCAVAGNFDNCVSVKIGDKDATYLSLCSNDGIVTAGQYQTDMPNEIECAARNAAAEAGEWFK